MINISNLKAIIIIVKFGWIVNILRSSKIISQKLTFLDFFTYGI